MGAEYIQSRMPPSKSDPVQRVGNELHFPGKLPEARVKGAKECIEDFVNDYPVPAHLHKVSPLFRTTREGAASQMTRAMFLHDFKRGRMSGADVLTACQNQATRALVSTNYKENVEAKSPSILF